MKEFISKKRKTKLFRRRTIQQQKFDRNHRRSKFMVKTKVCEGVKHQIKIADTLNGRK